MPGHKKFAKMLPFVSRRRFPEFVRRIRLMILERKINYPFSRKNSEYLMMIFTSAFLYQKTLKSTADFRF